MESFIRTRVPTLLKIGTRSPFERNEYIPTYKVGKTRSAFERNLNFYLPFASNSIHCPATQLRHICVKARIYKGPSTDKDDNDTTRSQRS